MDRFQGWATKRSLVIVLVLSFVGGFSSLSEAENIITGQVKGVLVNKATGQPVEITPGELNLFGSFEGMNKTEVAAYKKNKTNLEIKTYSSGAFLIKKVIPMKGKYYLVINNDITPPGFTVSPGQTVDLGTIKIER